MDYRKWARENYTPGEEISEAWTDEIRLECAVINEEVRIAEERARGQIKKVIVSTAKLEEEFSGNVVLYATFQRSIQKHRQMTKTELDKLLDGLTPEQRKKAKGDMSSSGKRLFSKDGFPELEELEGDKARWLRKFKEFGYPYLGKGMTAMKIALIPQAEDFMKEVQDERLKLVKKIKAAYPKAILPEAVDSLIYDPGDYAPVDSIDSMYVLSRRWMHLGVPEVLKEIDMALYEAERERTAKVWEEVKANGVALLRKQLSIMVDGLVDSMQPDAKGERKRFFASAITNMSDFFEQFDNRNLGEDTEMKGVIAKLKSLVSNKEIEEFKTNETLRAKVSTEGTKIQKQLQTMLVSASTRAISLED